MTPRTDAEQRALTALDIIDRLDPLHPAVTAAFAVLGAAMDEIYGPLPDLGGRRP